MRLAPIALAVALPAVLASGCGGGEDRKEAVAAPPRCSPGEHVLRLENGQAARMRVTPPGMRPYALIVALHGAGGSPASGLEAFSGAWTVPGIVLVAPAAKGSTWSAVFSDRDVDLESVNLVVNAAWARCPIERKRLALGGFSDGATYALSLGIANGDLFPAIIALSPGGLLAGTTRGQPRIFVSHGTEDGVLPIAGASDRIVPKLREAGYDITYRRFRGGHVAAPETSAAAARWFLDGLD